MPMYNVPVVPANYRNSQGMTAGSNNAGNAGSSAVGGSLLSGFKDWYSSQWDKNIVQPANMFGDWLNNALTGERDFQRQLQLQHDAQAFNALEAQKAYDRDLAASNTAVQRRAADLKAAGFNAAMAAGDAAQTVAAPVLGSSAGSAGRSGDGAGRLFGSLLSLIGVMTNANTALARTAMTVSAQSNNASAALEAARINRTAKLLGLSAVQQFRR